MAKRKQPGLYPTKAVRVAAETRRYQMLELTKGGATQRQIAETLGVSRGLVHKEIKRALQDLSQSATRTADAVRAIQMERYITLLSRWWVQAIAGDEAATRMVLSIMARIDIINGIIPDRPLVVTNNQFNQEVRVLELSSDEIAETLAILRDAGALGALASPNELHTPSPNGEAEGIPQS